MEVLKVAKIRFTFILIKNNQQEVCLQSKFKFELVWRSINDTLNLRQEGHLAKYQVVVAQDNQMAYVGSV